MLRLIVRLRNLVEKNDLRGFRAVLFRMVPKPNKRNLVPLGRFRAVLFRMVPKQQAEAKRQAEGFRAVLFRMVPKHLTV